MRPARGVSRAIRKGDARAGRRGPGACLRAITIAAVVCNGNAAAQRKETMNADEIINAMQYANAQRNSYTGQAVSLAGDQV